MFHYHILRICMAFYVCGFFHALTSLFLAQNYFHLSGSCMAFPPSGFFHAVTGRSHLRLEVFFYDTVSSCMVFLPVGSFMLYQVAFSLKSLSPCEQLYGFTSGFFHALTGRFQARNTLSHCEQLYGFLVVRLVVSSHSS